MQRLYVNRIPYYLLAYQMGKGFWFDIIKPATDTLLCYLMPYFAYALMRFIGLHLPAFALKGGVGLIKSFYLHYYVLWLPGYL